MMNLFTKIFRLAVVITLFIGVNESNAQFVDKKDVVNAQKSLNEKLKDQPAVFTKNRGQWENNILFRTQYENTNIYFTEKGLSFGLRKLWEGESYKADGTITKPGEAPAKFEYLVWDENFINSNVNSTWESQGEVKSNVNYFTNSNGDKPVLGTYDYKKITNKNVFEGVDVQYYLKDNKLKYDYIVKPEGDLKSIQLQFEGVDDYQLDKEGNLVVSTKWGDFKKTIPYSYQLIDGIEVEVKVEFELLEGTELAYGFKVIGNFNKDYDLIIDPVYIDWGSYFYGGGVNQNQQWTYSWTWVRDVDVDENNYVYITGMTTDKFPTDPGWYDTSFNGNYDGFLCKMKFDGTDIEWFSYIGGSGWDYLVSIRVTDAGDVFAIGTSSSTNFPITSNAYDKTNKNTTSSWWYGGSYVLMNMNTQGTKLKYSTFLNTGTTSNNYYYSWWLYNYPIEVNEKGEVIVALNYQVGSLTLPVKSYLLPQAFYTNTNTFANSASIILKMSADGSSILNSTLYGGAGNDAIFGLYLNDTGLLYIGSSTTSTNIPPTKGVPGFGTLPVGNGDGHIAIMDTGFTSFSVSKYIGGKGDDKIVALYGSNDGIYMLLETTSTDILGYKSTAGGGIDAAVIKIRPDGIKAIWGTFLGGGNREIPKGITANVREEVIIVGQTYSNNYPVTNDALKKTAGSNWNWAYNGFLTKLDYSGQPIYSTYLGGSGVDFLMGVTTKRIGCVTHIVVGGYTTSTDFHVTDGAWRDTVRSNNNGWWYGGAVLKMRDTLRLSVIDLGDTLIRCNEIYVRLDAENVGADYIWSTGDTVRRIIAKDSGTYWVRATYGCGTEVDSNHILLRRSPTYVLPDDTIYCDAIYDTLDAINDTIPEVTYTWNTNETTQKIVITDTGTYQVKIATKSCGTIYDNIHIGLLKKPDVTLPKDSIFCSAINLDIEAKNTNKEIEYFWSTKDTVKMITVTDTGLYKVVATNYCGKDSAQMLVLRDSTPNFNLPEDSVFCDNVNFEFSPGKYSGRTSIIHSRNYFDIGLKNGLDLFEIRDTGFYWVELDNACGSHKDSFTIKMLYSPTVNIPTVDTLCNFGTKNINVETINNDETYLWLPDNVNISSFTIKSPGQYIVQVSNKCAVERDTIDVAYYESPTVELGLDSVFCSSVNHSFTIGKANNGERYYWNGVQGTNTYAVSKEGIYKVEVRNYCGTANDSVEYSILALPQVSLGADKIFCGDAFPAQDLDAGNNGVNEQYEWSTNETTQGISVSTPGIYSVKVSNKCGEATDEMEIVLSPLPVVDLGLDTNFCGLFAYELDAGNTGSYYSWSPSGENSQNVTLTEYGNHEVTVTNPYGCVSKDDVYITQTCSTLFFLPNAFTPNDNGRNEVFKPVLNDIFEYQFNIYNRWGELVFSTTDINEGWDGSFAGVPCMQGMYLWTVSRLGVDKREHSNGSVFLKR